MYAVVFFLYAAKEPILQTWYSCDVTMSLCREKSFDVELNEFLENPYPISPRCFSMNSEPRIFLLVVSDQLDHAEILLAVHSLTKQKKKQKLNKHDDPHHHLFSLIQSPNKKLFTQQISKNN